MTPRAPRARASDRPGPSLIATRSLHDTDVNLDVTIYDGHMGLRMMEQIAATESDDYRLEFYRSGAEIELWVRTKDSKTLRVARFNERELLLTIANVTVDTIEKKE